MKRLLSIAALSLFTSALAMGEDARWIRLPGELSNVHSDQNQFLKHGFRIHGIRVGLAREADQETTEPSATVLIWSLRAERDMRYSDVMKMQQEFPAIEFQKIENGTAESVYRNFVNHTLFTQLNGAHFEVFPRGKILNVYMFYNDAARQQIIERQPNGAIFQK